MGPRAGDIGEPVRRIEFEPLTAPEPTVEPAPVEPTYEPVGVPA
jgi:hypothetical protein